MPKKPKQFSNELDAVLAFLKDEATEAELSASHQRKLERILLCDDLIRRHGSFKKVMPMLYKTINERYKEQGIKLRYTRALARKDFYDTQAVVGSTSKINRDYQVELLFEELREDRVIALAKKDANALARTTRNKILALEKFVGDADTPAYEQLQPALPVIGHFPDQLNSDLPRLEDGSVDEATLEKELEILSKVNRSDYDLFADVEEAS